MNIGFDLDGVFIDKPPFIPKKLIELFYRRQNTRKLTYRIPSRAEQYLRILSHYSFLRPPISKNIQALLNMERGNNGIYLISGRFEFLKDRTSCILNKYHLSKSFKEININLENNQPHLYKEKAIKKIGIKKYIDDDLYLLMYLSNRHPKVDFYWIENPFDKNKFDLPKNIYPIKDLEEFYNKYI